MAVSGLRDHLGLGVSRVGAAGLTLVFCEVKCRSGLGFGHPHEAITYTKMRTLRQLAAVWMREHRTKASSIRLDAIGVVLAPGQEPSLTHINVFTCTREVCAALVEGLAGPQNGVPLSVRGCACLIINSLDLSRRRP
jgi:Holliday junction resolvase-like predicted endonuclease